MKREKTLLLLVPLTIISLICLLFGVTNNQKIVFPENLSDESKIQLEYRGDILNLEVAESQEKHVSGLMGRIDLTQNQGMLFIFDEEAPRTFWMKNTPSSLDIIFLDKDLRVVKIQENTKPNQTDEVYQSEKPAKYVVEVKSGWIEKSKVEVGDQLTFKL